MTETQTYKGTAVVLGGGGFIGSHLVKRLKREGYWVRAVDLKRPEFSPSAADEFVQGDLRDPDFTERVLQFKGFGKTAYTDVPFREVQGFDLVFQLAADMGGAGFLFTQEHDAEIMRNSSIINLNVLEALRQLNDKLGRDPGATRVFYSSSACIYPEHNQLDPMNPDCREDSAYPASPDSEYGWEKLFSERLYLAFQKQYGIPVRIARYHNIFGPEGTWRGGREKAPAAICRKVASLPKEGGEVEVWGDGEQTRSFLFVDECVEATLRLTLSDFTGPVNIGSEEMVTINQLVDLAAKAAGKMVTKKNVPGPMGVRGRNSNNDLIREKLGWDFAMPLEQGIARTYAWIRDQL